MLRELDFIKSDWEAFLWALGSTTAICKHSGRGWRTWYRNRSQENSMDNMGKKAFGLVLGALSAAALVVVAFGLLWLAFLLFPSSGIDRAEWTHILTVIVIPEAIFIVAAVALWHKRRPMAVGILLSAALLATHVVVHIASHGLGH
jgi:hypothetical protein